MQIGGVLFRCDIIHDPISAVEARLPKDAAGLIKELASKKPFVSQYAAEALIKMGPAAAPALPEMFRLLRSGNALMEDFILRLAKSAGAASNPFLDNALDDSDLHVRRVAPQAIGEVGPNAATLTPKLLPGLDDFDFAVVLFTASALRKIDSKDVRAVPKLIEFLRSEDPTAKAGAILILGEYGQDAVPAVPLLIPFLQSTNFQEQMLAITTLGKIGPAASIAIPQLVRASQNTQQTYAVIEALSLMGPVGEQALIASFKTFYANNYIMLMKTLIKLGPKAESVVPLLMDELDKKGMKRIFAMMALANIGEKARVAIPRLETLISDSDPKTRLRAAEALWRLDQRTNAVMPVMLAEIKLWAGNTNALRQRTMDGTGESNEQLAARILGEIGPQAREAKPMIELMTRSSSADIRATATNALNRIQGRRI